MFAIYKSIACAVVPRFGVTRVKQALLSLQKKIFTYEDEKEWISISIIALPKIKKRSSVGVDIQTDSIGLFHGF